VDDASESIVSSTGEYSTRERLCFTGAIGEDHVDNLVFSLWPPIIHPWFRIKFSIPFATATLSLVFCLVFIFDCKSSIYVAGEWHGLFTHASDDSGSCVSYRNHPLPNLPSDDPQLLAAQIGSAVVLLLGVPLWICLAASPCWKCPNQVWPKIISIIVALLIGNAQLFSVVKFIRRVLDAYPEEKAYYDRRFVVMGSVFFWLLTGVAIGLCGVKPPEITNQLRTPVVNSSSSAGKTLTKSPSEDTKETKDAAELIDLHPSISLETKETNDLEEGMIQIRNSCSGETEDGEDGQAIELSLLNVQD
jgi:hypothetical protein